LVTIAQEIDWVHRSLKKSTVPAMLLAGWPAREPPRDKRQTGKPRSGK
jgi:hypothetical protein